MQDIRAQDVGRKSEESPTDIEQKSNESPTDVGRAELSRRCCNGRWRRCTAAPGNATLRRGRQSVATRYYGEVGRALLLAVVARPTAGCSSLLWQWPVALQLAAMADSALQPWPTLRCSVFVFYFLFFTRQL
jgi:hypothetical protein